LSARCPRRPTPPPSHPAAGKTRPGTLPELTADLTRTPAKDRLLEDFERRFESSLARAAGANGQSPLNALSPLASAGLPAGMQAPGGTLPVAQATVSTPIGHPAFAADLSHRVLLFAGQRVQSAQITVTPNDLGPISVSIEMHGQEAAIQFSAAHATTRAAIEDAMPRLREMLAAQGLQLTQADVGDQTQRDAHAAYGERQAGRSAGANGTAGGSAAGTPVDAERSTLRRIGLIDIRV
jgi:flagellar hook-length control protein FliK